MKPKVDPVILMQPYPMWSWKLPEEERKQVRSLQVVPVYGRRSSSVFRDHDLIGRPPL